MRVANLSLQRVSECNFVAQPIVQTSLWAAHYNLPPHSQVDSPKQASKTRHGCAAGACLHKQRRGAALLLAPRQHAVFEKSVEHDVAAGALQWQGSNMG